uniref:NADH-ubiquinone oxidoreductase chain 2 n=1 Tax=Macoma balthica TaxID=1903275 RepID=A0A0B4U5K9_MACBL|nr:NADH deshydrogenase subunit 2 [Macoma balthica]
MVSLLGTMFVFLSSGLFGMWISLELGFFGFLPILNGKAASENEAAVKYFVIQSVGSGLILVSFLLFSSSPGFISYLSEEMVDIIMIGGFMVKLGVFPFHFWFPSVMSMASWFSCFWLSVVQKVGPFWGISGLGVSCWLVDSFIIFLVITSLVGALGGLAQVQFRPLLAYSSLGQTGWMGLIALLSVDLFFFYMILYTILLVGLLLTLHIINSYSVVNIPGWSFCNGLMFWVFCGGFFISLSGLPPLAGSALKLMGILVVIGSYPVTLVFLILSSMISLYYYLSMFITSVSCLGSSNYGLNTSFLDSKGLMLLISSMMVLNWAGGLPLFIMCGSFVL